ncbi:MAG TPA: hypothetical protein PLK35_00665 [Candidatus Moranbacteria bacterium]|nr:hypothetical protein [Candidatus Moranbacteria bacterium]
MNKRIPSVWGFVIIALAAVVSVTFMWLATKSGEISGKINEKKPLECTMEARVCPDGSSVGRTGPNCEFEPCPTGNLVGNDKDEHGCIGSAGYIWCEEKQKCLRIWNESCSDLLEYKNFKHGYYVKYPRSWFAYTEKVDDVFFQPRSEEENDYNDPHALSFEIKVSDFPANSSLDKEIEKIINKGVDAGRSIRKEEIEISGEKGLKVMTCGKFECNPEKYFVVKDGKLYFLNPLLGWTKEFENILNTFKFVSQ